MTLEYVATPFLAWLVTGCIKFLVNCAREKRLAFDLIGYGGMPSNHASISSSVMFLIAMKEGLESPALGIAVAFVFIVLLDASSLRRQVGLQASAINRVAGTELRERIGHSRWELLAGLAAGFVTALAVFQLAS